MLAQTLAYAFGAEHKILMSNLKQVSHEDSLRCAGEAANGINWLAGHILGARGRMAARIGAGGPFLNDQESAFYGKGSQPIRAGDPCIPLDMLVEGLKESSEKILARLETITDAELAVEIDRKLFPIPPGKPTLGASVMFLIVHEAYHNGQIGIVRRAIGKVSGIGA
jgi:hypothetical protein